ncbi:hypothetical protein KB976_004036 [Vibrio parahaemolyticus]|nr:hypothetical protein [Vibrio parahaemolyticus]
MSSPYPAVNDCGNGDSSMKQAFGPLNPLPQIFIESITVRSNDIFEVVQIPHLAKPVTERSEAKELMVVVVDSSAVFLMNIMRSCATNTRTRSRSE